MSSPAREMLANRVTHDIKNAVRGANSEDLRALALCETIDQAGLNIMSVLSGIREELQNLNALLHVRLTQ